MTNRHLMSRIRRLERDVQERSIVANPQAILEIANRSTQRTRKKFVTGCEDDLDVQAQEDNELLRGYLHRIKGIDMNADRERSKMLQFGSRGT